VISFIIATIGRPSLADTLRSIECWPGDEVLVIGNVPDKVEGHVRYISSPPGNDWGSTERNIATPLATGRFLSHMDDDDIYAPGHRALMSIAADRAPDRPTIFRMQFPDGSRLWREPEVRWGNVGTPMMFLPNLPENLGQWGEKQDCGDIHFLQTMGWPHTDLVWATDVVALIGQRHA
jgi:hypothetical protein